MPERYTPAQIRMAAAIVRAERERRQRRARLLAAFVAVATITAGTVATVRQAASHAGDLADLRETGPATALHRWMVAHYTDHTVGMVLIVGCLLVMVVSAVCAASGRTVSTAPRSMGAGR